MGAYEALREASARTYMDNRQIMQERRARLLAEVNQGDALTLRKVEREELMKNVIRWLFGPGFHFSPPGVPSNFYGSGGAVVNQGTAAKVLSHGRLISFLHQALEWENVNSFLYPYFWTPRPRWTDRLEDSARGPSSRGLLARGCGPGRSSDTSRVGECLPVPAVDGQDRQCQPSLSNHRGRNRELRANQLPRDSFRERSFRDRSRGQLRDQRRRILITSWYEYTPTSAVDIKVGETAPTEGEFQQPAFAPPIPDKAWWLDPQVGQAVAAVLAALADKLDDTD